MVVYIPVDIQLLLMFTLFMLYRIAGNFHRVLISVYFVCSIPMLKKYENLKKAKIKITHLTFDLLRTH